MQQRSIFIYPLNHFTQNINRTQFKRFLILYIYSLNHIFFDLKSGSFSMEGRYNHAGLILNVLSAQCLTGVGDGLGTGGERRE